MKNKHIKSREVVPTELRLEIYKEALNRNWRDNEIGLCHLLPMLLWGFTNELDAYKKFEHKFWYTKDMFPELVAELPKIARAINENKVRVNSLNRMIKKIESNN